MIAAGLAAALAVLGGGASPPSVALTVAPAHVELQAGAKATVRVGPTSGARLVLHTSVTGLRLDARGRPAIGGKPDAAGWLQVAPAAFTVGPRGASFVVSSRRPAHARPGDHTAIVLLTARTPSGKGVTVAMRIGLVVTVGVRGHLVRQIDVTAIRVQRTRRERALVEVTVENRGDVIESVGGPLFRLTFSKRGHVLARPRVARRSLLPRSRAVLTFRCRVHGVVVARIEPGGAGRRAPPRSFRLRL